MLIPQEQISEITEGLSSAGIDKLKYCDAVYSGYLGSPEQGQRILELVQEAKKANPNALYVTAI